MFAARKSHSAHVFLPIFLAAAIMLVLAVALGAASPARAGGVVGSGIPASCTESAFDTALTGGGLITFNCGGPATITLTAYKQIADSTTIDGGGQITLTNPTGYLFQVFASSSLTLTDLTLTGGSSNITGAIENFGATVLLNSQIKNNTSSNTGGAILNYGTLQVQDSLFISNKADAAGGAIANDGGEVRLNNIAFNNNSAEGALGKGGAIANLSGRIFVDGSDFSGNTALDGAAIYQASGAQATVSTSSLTGNSGGYGGGIENNGDITVTLSTIANNTVSGDGGGLWNLNGVAIFQDSSIQNNTAGTTGGGISHYGGEAFIRRVTLSGNTAGSKGGGVYGLATLVLTNTTLSGNTATGDGGGGVYQGQGTATLQYVTMTDNTGLYGSGVYNEGSNAGNNMYLQNVLLAGNGANNCDGVLTSLGNNLSDDTNCGGAFTQPGDQNSVSLPLKPLASYGGPTQAHMPLLGSAAIDGGMCIGGVSDDQRGVSRPQGSTCDVGAVEVMVGEANPKAYLPIVHK